MAYDEHKAIDTTQSKLKIHLRAQFAHFLTVYSYSYPRKVATILLSTTHQFGLMARQMQVK